MIINIELTVDHQSVDGLRMHSVENVTIALAIVLAQGKVLHKGGLVQGQGGCFGESVLQCHDRWRPNTKSLSGGEFGEY